MVHGAQRLPLPHYLRRRLLHRWTCTNAHGGETRRKRVHAHAHTNACTHPQPACAPPYSCCRQGTGIMHECTSICPPSLNVLHTLSTGHAPCMDLPSISPFSLMEWNSTASPLRGFTARCSQAHSLNSCCFRPLGAGMLGNTCSSASSPLLTRNDTCPRKLPPVAKRQHMKSQRA